MTPEHVAILGCIILALVLAVAIVQCAHAIAWTIDGIRYELTQRRLARQRKEASK